MQNGTRRSCVVRWPPVRLSRTMRNGIFDIHTNLLARSSLDTRHGGIQQHLDALVPKEFEERSPDIGLLSARELRSSLDHREARAKTADGLRQFEADIAAADDDKVSWDARDRAPQRGSWAKRRPNPGRRGRLHGCRGSAPHDLQ